MIWNLSLNADCTTLEKYEFFELLMIFVIRYHFTFFVPPPPLIQSLPAAPRSCINPPVSRRLYWSKLSHNGHPAASPHPQVPATATLRRSCPVGDPELCGRCGAKLRWHPAGVLREGVQHKHRPDGSNLW